MTLASVSDRRKTRSNVNTERRRALDRRKNSRRDGDVFSGSDRDVFFVWFALINKVADLDYKKKKKDKKYFTMTIKAPTVSPNKAVRDSIMFTFKQDWDLEVKFEKGGRIRLTGYH